MLYTGIGLLYLPILTLIAYSFNSSPLVNVWGSFSTVWYTQLLHNRQLLQSPLLTLEVADSPSTGAVVLGTLASVALVLTRKDQTRVADTAGVIRELEDSGAHVMGTLFNAC